MSRGDILIVTALDKNLSRFVVRDVLMGDDTEFEGPNLSDPEDTTFSP